MTFAMNSHFGLAAMMMTTWCLLAALHQQGAHAQQQQGQDFASLGPYEYAEMKVLCIRQDDADSSLDGNSNGATAAALPSQQKDKCAKGEGEPSLSPSLSAVNEDANENESEHSVK